MNKLEKALAEAGWGEPSVMMPNEVFEWFKTNDFKIIKPLRKVEKQDWRLDFWTYQDDHRISKVATSFDFPPAQAEKVAAFLEAGMEYIAKDQIIFQTDHKLFETLKQAAIEAREALEGTNG